jgi:hypothetical protein
MKICLPDRIILTCPAKHTTTVAARDLAGVDKVACPMCGASFPAYEGLEPRLKRRVYARVRDYLETVFGEAFDEVRLWTKDVK